MPVAVNLLKLVGGSFLWRARFVAVNIILCRLRCRLCLGEIVFRGRHERRRRCAETGCVQRMVVCAHVVVHSEAALMCPWSLWLRRGTIHVHDF